MKTLLDIRNRPYQLLLFTAIMLFLSIAFSPNGILDFQDITAFSLPLVTVLHGIPIFLISLWLFYTITNRLLYSLLVTRIHVFSTALAAILILVMLYIGVIPFSETKVTPEIIGNSIQLLTLLFAFAQLTLIANFLLGIFSKRKPNYS